MGHVDAVEAAINRVIIERLNRVEVQLRQVEASCRVLEQSNARYKRDYEESEEHCHSAQRRTIEEVKKRRKLEQSNEALIDAGDGLATRLSSMTTLYHSAMGHDGVVGDCKDHVCRFSGERLATWYGAKVDAFGLIFAANCG